MVNLRRPSRKDAAPVTTESGHRHGPAHQPALFILLSGKARDIGRRLLDGVDATLVDRADHAVRSVPRYH
jgi:hypothetical protein